MTAPPKTVSMLTAMRMKPMALMMIGVVTVGGSAGCNHGSKVFDAPEVADCGGPPVSGLRLVTWNIRWAVESSLDRIVEVLSSQGADVIALQEVDRVTPRSDGVDQAEEIARRLGMTSTFAAARSEGTGDFGIAILSKLPFIGAERRELPGGFAFEPRVALDGRVCVGPGESVRVATVHADIYPWSRQENLRSLARTTADSVGGGVIIAGDFNDTPDGPSTRLFEAGGLMRANSPVQPTFATSVIDHVFVDEAMVIADTTVVDSDASDHRPVVVDLERRER